MQAPAAAALPPSLQAAGPSSAPQMITTQKIQLMLEENARLIRAIQENQNAGKLHACTQYQQTLQQNLMYLAAVADAQPQPQQGKAPPLASAGAPAAYPPQPQGAAVPPRPAAQQPHAVPQPQAQPAAPVAVPVRPPPFAGQGSALPGAPGGA